MNTLPEQALILVIFLALYSLFLYYIPNTLNEKFPEVDFNLNEFVGRVNIEDTGVLLNELFRKHKGEDSSGFIYIYQRRDDVINDPSLIKIGRTAAKVGVNRRISQWESK
jgi:hypothetical protein